MRDGLLISRTGMFSCFKRRKIRSPSPNMNFKFTFSSLTPGAFLISCAFKPGSDADINTKYPTAPTRKRMPPASAIISDVLFMLKGSGLFINSWDTPVLFYQDHYSQSFHPDRNQRCLLVVSYVGVPSQTDRIHSKSSSRSQASAAPHLKDGTGRRPSGDSFPWGTVLG